MNSMSKDFIASLEKVDSQVGSHSFAVESLSTTSHRADLQAELRYHELSQTSVRAVSPLDQLEKNIMELQDLRSRLNFMLREVRYFLKR